MQVRSFALFLSLAAAFGGCNSKSDDVATGEVSVLLTDAASDELDAFEVDVQNIVFTKLGGSTVSVMPRTTRVDFTELETVGELVAGLGLEAGIYSRISMTLDFTNAVVCIAGQTSAATVLDKDGNPITGPVDVHVDFAANAQPLVGVTRHHMFVLDLDLEQSLSVDAANNTVTFCPALHADVDPTNPKPVATTGFLVSVDPMGDRFVVERRELGGAAIAQFTVATNASTVWQLDGVVSLGMTGLHELANHVGSRVWLQGTLDPTTRLLRAVAVEGGAGIPGNGQDWVFGHVVARDNGAGSDATLTVLGRSRDESTGARRFNTLHTVAVSVANTKVLRRGAGNSLDSDALNVGQLVWAFGDLSDTTLSATAATGVVRMLPTSVFGIAAAAPVNGTLTVDLVRFDLRDDDLFDFTVGGNAQADPDAYTVDVGALDTTGIGPGTKLRVFAWINPVDVTTDNDCTALTIVNRSSDGRVLFCEWSPASTAAIGATTATSITFDVTGTTVSAVGDGFAPVAINNTPAPTLQPLAALGVYRIVQDGSVELHLGFDGFRQSLALRAAVSPVFRLAAIGTWDEAMQVFRGLVVTVVLD
jgi:hypothetical protein